MFSKYFDKITSLKIGNFDYSDFKVDFSYQIGIEDKVGELTMTLYNLSPTSIERLKKGTQIEFGYGYDKVVVPFFNGLIDSYSHVEGVTAETEVVCFGYSQTVFKPISRSYTAGTMASYVIEDICKNTGLNLQQLELANDITYSKGYNVYTKPLLALTNIAKSCGSKLTVRGENIFIYKNSMGLKKGVEFDFTSGLLATPNTIQSSISQNREESKENFKKPSATHLITTLANPNVNKHDVVKVLDILYRVESMSISDWKTEMEVIKI